MIKLFSNKYETREVFSDEELDAIARSKNQVVLVEGCLCVLMLDPSRLARVVGQLGEPVRADLLALLLKRVVLGFRHYSGAVRALLALGASAETGLVSDLMTWAMARGSLELADEFGGAEDRAFLRAALVHRHVAAARILLARLGDTVYERELAAKLGLDLF